MDGLQKRLFTGHRRFEHMRPRDEGNSLVSQRRHVLHCLAYTAQVIDPQVADSRTTRTNINENQRNLSQLQILQQRILHAEGHDGYAFDLPFDHSAHGAFHLLRVVHGGG